MGNFGSGEWSSRSSYGQLAARKEDDGSDGRYDYFPWCMRFVSRRKMGLSK